MEKMELTVELLRHEAKIFAEHESEHHEPTLYGITDGKAVGTYVEHKFQHYLHTKYDYIEGLSAKGIDFPELFVDMKVTSIKQPQSSCPSSLQNKKFGDWAILCSSLCMKNVTTIRARQGTSVYNTQYSLIVNELEIFR